MTTDNVLVLGIMAVAVALLVSEKLRVDVAAMLVLVTLTLSGLITTEEAFAGFASPAVITVWSVFIVSGALHKSGVADVLARYMLRLAGHNPARLTVVIMLTVGLMSAFMNNIGAVAILMPAVISVAHKVNTAPSRLLIPLSFASLLGGKMTMIGTPPNILASSIMETYGDLPPFGFFDFAPMGALVLAAGVVYMVLVGRRLLPERPPGGDLAKTFQTRNYLTEVQVRAGSSLAGQTVAETRFGERYDLTVLHIRRDDGQVLLPASDRRLRAGDTLLVEGAPGDILRVSAAHGLEVVPEGAPAGRERKAVPDGLEVVEVSVAPRSTLNGRTLKQADFRTRYDLTVMAIQHQGKSFVSRLADVPLSFGDVLFIQGPPDKVNLLRRDHDFMVLDAPPLEMRRTHKAPLAVAILLGVVVAVTLGWLHISTAMLIGALLTVLTGVHSMDEAYQSIEWKPVFLIAGMLSLGVAMQKTGTAAFLADQVIALVGGWGPLAVLMGIFLLTALLTEVMANSGATVLVVPIAIDAARSLGADPRVFVMAVVIAAATSFITPFGHKVNVLVFSPGGYRFLDYTKVGVWLNLIILVLVVIFLPMIWPLFP